jgi:hypothetical protein
MTPERDRDFPAYASLAAFLAHYRALAAARSRSEQEDRVLAAMRKHLDTIPADERSALDSEADTPAARRHRERAETRLRRELIARGALAG